MLESVADVLAQQTDAEQDHAHEEEVSANSVKCSFRRAAYV